MKKMLRVGLFLLAGVLFVSCQKESLPNVVQWEGIVKVNPDGSFTDGNKVVLVPTIPTSTTAAMVSIKCQFNPAEVNSGRVRVTLFGDPADVDGHSREVDRIGASNDVSSNAAIAGFTQGAYGPLFFDAQTLLVPIFFYVKQETDALAMQTEVNRHSFSLLCYTSLIAAGDTELKLYFRHAVQGGVSTERVSKVWMFRAYPIADILKTFKAKSGNEKPSAVRIYFDENPKSDKFGGGNSNEQSLELRYDF